MSTQNALDLLYVSDVFGNPSEVINGARTAARLIEAQQCGDGSFSDVLDNAGCDSLERHPCVMAEDGSVQSWVVMDTSAGAAPWYNGSDASLEGYGFYIEEWTGLDDAHNVRSATGVGMTRGGSVYGPLTHNHRVMMLNVLLLGESERGINHLFRWLSATLARCCDPCGDHQMWLREFCPVDPVDYTEGFARLAGVVLLEGPRWEAPISERSGCQIRRASFTLAAGDPCMYRESVSCLAETPVSDTGLRTLLAPILDLEVAANGEWVAAGVGVQCSAALPLGPGTVAAKVTITSAIEITTAGLRRYLPDFRIAGFTNPAGTAIFGGTARKVGELVLTGRGTSGLEIVVDLAERNVKYREGAGPWESWIDGSRLIGRPVEPGISRWWSLDACDDGVIVVEPIYRSAYNTSHDSNDEIVTAWTVEIDTIERFSCC